MFKLSWFTGLFALTCVSAFAQQTGVYGSVKDALTREPVELALVYLEGSESTIVETDSAGYFELFLPFGKWKPGPEQKLHLHISRLGYSEYVEVLKPLKQGERRQLEIFLSPSYDKVEIVVEGNRLDEQSEVHTGVEKLRYLPSSTGNLESVLPSIALGASSGTGGELSSQYNVRGGNYDENLVYVNDFEIYRPQLIRSSQQEGLTFANLDLVRDLSFFSGAFQARYGDKLSSVLDIRYKRPQAFKASVGFSLLGASAHVEGSKGVGAHSWRRFRYLLGARYKTTAYLLGSLDVTGEYVPNFSDIQGFFTYDLSPYWQVGLLLNYNRSKYSFVPRTRSTAIGLISFALELYSEFEGQEIDDFSTDMAGLSLTYLPERDKNPYYLKFLFSVFESIEQENYDLLGSYSLRQIENDQTSDNFGEVLAVLGTGVQQSFARNSFYALVQHVQHKGGFEWSLAKGKKGGEQSFFLQWGAGFKNEFIQDFINEWERLDSAGYSLPYQPDSVLLYSVLKSQNILASHRFSVYLQNTYSHELDSVAAWKATIGLRYSYWDMNGESLISPRVQLLYKPLKGKKDISWRLAGGYYHQPPFYRELRRADGSLNTGLRAQKSAQALLGFTWDFLWKKISKKPFRLIGEVYYKWLWDLVSYDVDNVRIRYSGENDASGYATGLDLRLNGEFVPGAESWVNLSLLRTRERLLGVQHLQRELGYEESLAVKDVPRPTDQLLALSLFFQDYLPRNENFKMHMTISFGTGLPFGLRGSNRIYRNTYRFPPYHRVDMGFSVLLWDAKRRAERPQHPLRFTQRTWLSLEVYNLMDVRNVASHTWVKTIFLQQYAIPNYLTSRRINLRVKMDF